MTRTYLNIVTFISTALISTIASASTYICTAESTIAYVKNEKTNKWSPMSFKGQDFVIRPLKPENIKDDQEYGVYSLDGSFIFGCPLWIDNLTLGHCGDIDDNIKFSYSDKKGRFVSSRAGTGYLLNENFDNPRISIGSCQKVKL